MTTSKPTDKSQKSQTEGMNIPFEDEKGMYGTSPVLKELSDEEVEHLTSKTLPRVRLSRSFRKISMYMSLFMIMIFMPQICYHRTSEITGLVVGPVYGLGEIGLVVVCTILSIINFFLIAPEDANSGARHAIRFIGTVIPLALLGAIYALPVDLVYRLTGFLY
jgi:hypothetical protein